VAEIGLAILIVGLLVLMDPDRARWAERRIRQLFDWLTSG
jgi:hypothetical protein